MRVIAGDAKGRRLAAPKGVKTRPTGDRVKEAVFNVLAPYIVNARFLDLFAGSGAMGIEALSRGAETAVFVENNWQAVRVIKENLDRVSFVDRSQLIEKDVFYSLSQLGNSKFDVVYADPPYNNRWGEEILRMLVGNNLLAAAAVVLVETRKTDALPDEYQGLVLASRRRYGDTVVHIYCRAE